MYGSLSLAVLGLSAFVPSSGEPTPQFDRHVVIEGRTNQNIAFPRVFRDGRTTYLSYSVGRDYMDGPETEYRSLKTTDDGVTWTRAGDFNYGSALRAGPRLIAPQRGDARGRLTEYVNGVKTVGSIHYDSALKPGATAIFGSPVIEAGDRYYVTFYAKFGKFSHGLPSACLATSADGVNWTQKATLADPVRLHRGTFVVYSEASLTRLTNGRFFTAIRTDELAPGPPVARVGLWALRQSYSTNLGRTWTSPQILKTAQGTSIGSHAAPHLLMVGKTLYMAHGRPDNYVSRAPTLRNGLPEFLPQHQVYANRQVRGFWAHGSSGYSALAVLSGRVVSFVDRCAASWGCPPNAKFTDAGTPAILMVPAR
jgi:hypothetical protein